MKNRLRNQQVTVKPRIVANDGTFKVEYYGMIVKDHCATGWTTFEQAVEYANRVARRNPRVIETINRQRAAQRNQRIARRRAVWESAHRMPVAA